jgi:hypothetical protein
MRTELSLRRASSRIGPGRPSQGLRRLTKGADEGAAYAFGITETATHCDPLDRLRPAFDSLARCFETEALDRLCRRHPDFGGESAGEMAGAHRGAIGQPLDRKPFVEALARPGEPRREPAAGAVRLEQRRELRLPAGRRWWTTSCWATRLAAGSPRSSVTSASARSMPVVTPAEVQTAPSRMTIRSGSTRICE